MSVELQYKPHCAGCGKKRTVIKSYNMENHNKEAEHEHWTRFYCSECGVIFACRVKVQKKTPMIQV